jgi:DNA polymerase-3 subunit chi
MKVEFHTGLVDKVGAACRFLRNAQAAGASVVVCGDRAGLDRLDVALWTFEPLSFVPHVRLKGGAGCVPALARTPVWLVDDPAVVPARQVLVNVGPAMVDGWSAFERVVELVSTEADDSNAGRQRWRQYAARVDVALVHQAPVAPSR